VDARTRAPKWLAAVVCTLAALYATKAHAEGIPANASSDAPRPNEATFARVRFALQAEPAFGIAGGRFYNQLVGARVDYRFTEEIALGSYLGYANLKGKDGRAHDVLPYLNLEYRPRLGANSAFGLPLGFGSGYLPNNGPFMRLSVGLSYAVSPQTDIVIAFLTPTFWVVHDRTVISLGTALEVSYAP